MSNVKYADVAELADALASGASDRKVMWVQVPSSAPKLHTDFDTMRYQNGVQFFYAKALDLKAFLQYLTIKGSELT